MFFCTGSRCSGIWTQRIDHNFRWNSLEDANCSLLMTEQLKNTLSRNYFWIFSKRFIISCRGSATYTRKHTHTTQALNCLPKIVEKFLCRKWSAKNPSLQKWFDESLPVPNWSCHFVLQVEARVDLNHSFNKKRLQPFSIMQKYD